MIGSPRRFVGVCVVGSGGGLSRSYALDCSSPTGWCSHAISATSTRCAGGATRSWRVSPGGRW